MNAGIIQPQRKKKKSKGLRRLLWVSVIIYLLGLVATTIILSNRNHDSSAAAALPKELEPGVSEEKGPGAVAHQEPEEDTSDPTPPNWRPTRLPQVGLAPNHKSPPNSDIAQEAAGATDNVSIVEWEYKKCWDEDGSERRKGSCTQLTPMENKISAGLGAMSACKTQHSGIANAGILNLMIEVDIRQNLLSIWNAGDSSLRFANPTIACIASNLRATPLADLKSEFARYQLKAVVSFTGPIRAAAQSAKADDQMVGAFEATGVAARVTSDKVRVRKTPIEGEILGLISAGNNVLIVDERTDENNEKWCRVLTPNKNVGWMVCWALERAANIDPAADSDSPANP